MASAARPARGAEPADLVLHGGVVHTMDAARTRAQAIAVAKGRIVAVGSDDQVAPSIGPATEVIDLGGRMVLPGFHDSHVHPIGGGLQALSCNLEDARTVEAITTKVRACAQATPSGWVIGGGWDLSLFAHANPHRTLLDAAAPDRPVLLTGADGHSAWASTKALALAGVDRATPDPPHGRIERDPATGEPSGTLRESAMGLVASKLPPSSREQRRAALRHALALAASRGITSMIDPVADADDLALYRDLDAAGELTAHVLACAQPMGRGAAGSATNGEPGASITGRALARGGLAAIRSLGWPSRAATASRVTTGCLKVFVDGVLEGETAALLEPYLDSPAGERGELKFDPGALAQAVTRWDAEGIQVHFHAIGDRAVRSALDAVAAARRANGARDTRHHLAHLQLVSAEDVPRFAALDATATFQALWAFPDSYIENVNLAQVGPERVARMYPIGSIHRAGGRIAAGSDWPVSSIDPLLAIEVALTRQDPAGGDPDTLNATERVDLDTMLAAFTREGAWLMRQESEDGSIEAGKRADLVVLARDLFAIPAADLGEVAVERTIVEGKTVYRRDG